MWPGNIVLVSAIIRLHLCWRCSLPLLFSCCWHRYPCTCSFFTHPRTLNVSTANPCTPLYHPPVPPAQLGTLTQDVGAARAAEAKKINLEFKNTTGSEKGVLSEEEFVSLCVQHGPSALHAEGCSTGVAPRGGPLHGGVADLCYTDVRSILILVLLGFKGRLTPRVARACCTHHSNCTIL